MGDPLFRIRDTVRRHKVVVLSSNYALYGDMSARLMTLLGQFTPRLEAYSIDEAFLDYRAITPAWPHRGKSYAPRCAAGWDCRFAWALSRPKRWPRLPTTPPRRGWGRRTVAWRCWPMNRNKPAFCASWI